MQISTRYRLTAAVAALTATAIIAAPITPVSRDVATQASSISTVSADPVLASVLTTLANATNDVIDGFQGAGEAAANAVTSVINVVNLTTQSTVQNTASLINSLLNFSVSGPNSVIGGFLDAATLLLPSPFGAALSDAVDGFLLANQTLVTGFGGAMVTIAKGALQTLSSSAAVLLAYGITYPRLAVNAIVDGFEAALVSVAGFDVGQAVTDVVDGLKGGAGFLAMGAQNAGLVVSSTASTLFSLAKSFATAFVTYPVAAVQAAYEGIKAAFAEFGIPLPFAAVKPKAVPAAVPAAAGLAPAKSVAAAEATDGTDEQAPAPKAAKSSPKKAAAVRQPVAPTTSAVGGQHDSPDSSSSGRSETKHGSDRAGGSRASRHDAA